MDLAQGTKNKVVQVYHYLQVLIIDWFVMICKPDTWTKWVMGWFVLDSHICPTKNKLISVISGMKVKFLLPFYNMFVLNGSLIYHVSMQVWTSLHIQILLTGHEGLKLRSTTVVTASWSSCHGILQLLSTRATLCCSCKVFWTYPHSYSNWQ